MKKLYMIYLKLNFTEASIHMNMINFFSSMLLWIWAFCPVVAAIWIVGNGYWLEWDYMYHSRLPSWIILTTSIVLITIFLYQQFQPMPFKGQCFTTQLVAVVTGGATGLGQEFVACLLTRDISEIIVLDVQKPPPSVLDNPKVRFFQADVGSEQTIINTLHHIQLELHMNGKYISVLINNAGKDFRGAVTDTWPDISRVFSVNMFAHYWAIRAVIRFREEHSIVEPLCIVAVSLVLGYLSPRNLTLYSALKAAVTQLYEGLALEISREEIGFLVVVPGQLDLQMFRDVTPSNSLLAPIVEARWLANKVIERVLRGQMGVLCVPLYGNILPVVKVMPIFLQHFCRWFADMDNKIETVVDVKG